MGTGDQIADIHNADISLCFIETVQQLKSIPRVQRLDGIYYNTRSNYNLQNSNILKTYRNSDGVIFQSEYGKRLVTKFFGDHKNSQVIYNGADIETINSSEPITDSKGRKIWSCAASWRPHKRLSENIRYFLEHKGKDDILIIAGDTPKTVQDKNICYAGNLTQTQLYSLYKASAYFIHLGWLDCCPNVVIDARACGATIICSTSGGTSEIAGLDSIIIEEPEWDFEPLDLYNPPILDFSKKLNNTLETEYDIRNIAQQYTSFMREFI